MKIEKVERFRVDDREFTTLAKAKDHVDGLVNRILQASLIEKGFSVSEIVKITDTVLDNRAALVMLLSCEFEKEIDYEEDDDR